MSDETPLGEMMREANRFSRQIDGGIIEMKVQAVNYADAERDYRKAKAEAWVTVRARYPDMLAADKQAWVDATTADLRHTRDIAEGMRKAAVEAVRSRRAQLSAVQTFANAYQAEADFARTGPR